MRRRFINLSNKFDYTNYMTIEALEDNVTVTLTNRLYYNLNGTNWKVYGNTITLSNGDFLSFKYTLSVNDNLDAIRINGKCNLRGNCLSLIFGDDAVGKTDISNYYNVFYSLFATCRGIIEVEPTFLPATTLADDCYNNMFNGCTSLVNAPELPATTLADDCYNNMFNGCTSLVNAPELPATTLVASCYHSMFRGCKKLNYIKMLATSISALDCLRDWVSGVASSGTFVKNSAMNSLLTGQNGIPKGWTVVNDGEESGGNLITFTIDGIEYQAKEGITWGEWVDSEYNVINASIYQQSNGLDYISLGIEQGSPNVIHDSSFFPVLITNEIIANHSYNAIVLGGGV